MSIQRLPELGRRDLALEMPRGQGQEQEQGQYNRFHELPEQRVIQSYFHNTTTQQRDFDQRQISLYDQLQRNIRAINNEHSVRLEIVVGPDNNVNGLPRNTENMFDEVSRSGVIASRTNRDAAIESAKRQYSENLTALAPQYNVNLNELNRIRNEHGIDESNLKTIYPDYNGNGGRRGKRKRKKSKTKHRKKSKTRKTKRRLL